MKFYVDSCVYLNLWQKEQKWWKKAADFFEAIDNPDNAIFVSGFVLKELGHILTAEEFSKRRILFNSAIFQKVIASEQDYSNAREFERESEFELSFFDCMHVALSKRIGAILITRDRKLIEFAAKKQCAASRPEDVKIY
ncbi:PIN domain-containing protein [Candidatus Woesearchaeota archaeon]|nr:PIN domain-containing protein [Candidatus Woesearchaeota archaeon]